MFDHGITNRHLSMLTKHYHEHYHVYDNDIIRNPECRVSLNHWMALLLLPQFHFTHHSLPPCSLFLSLSLSPLPFPYVSLSCVGGRLESPESTTRITRSISGTIFLSHLFYMVYPSVSFSSQALSLTRSLWLIPIFTLCPSSHSLLLGERERQREIEGERDSRGLGVRMGGAPIIKETDTAE